MVRSIFNPLATIRGQLGLAFGAALLIVVGLGAFSLTQLRAVNQVATELVALWRPKVRALDDIKRAATSHRLLATRRMQTTNFRQLAALARNLRKASQEIQAHGRTFLSHPGGAREAALFDAFDAAWGRYVESFAATVERLDGGEISAATEAFEAETIVYFDAAVEELNALITLSDQLALRAEARAADVYERAWALILLAIAAATIIVVGAMVWISKRISSPLQTITDAMENLIAGDHADIQITGARRNDEIGVLASAANGYRDSLICSRRFAEEAECERNRALEALRSNKAKSLLLANVSHELRTPMNAICGFSEMMMAEIFGPVQPPRYAEYVRGIHDSGRILLKNIDDLLDISRIEVDKFGWREKQFEFAPQIERTVATCRASFPNRRIELKIDPAAASLYLLGDPERLGQAVINLVGNAVRFSEESTEILVEVEAFDDSSIALHVRDQGCGIAPENIEHILRPFGQVQEDCYSASGGGLGLGLGLAITKEIVRRLGGALEIDSQLGAGSTFSIFVLGVPYQEAQATLLDSQVDFKACG